MLQIHPNHLLTILLATYVIVRHQITMTTAQELVPEETIESSYRKLTNLRQTRDDLTQLLKVLHEIDQDLQHQHSSLDDVDRKRRGLEILKRILSEMDHDLIRQQKRVCFINLGSHCNTENAAAVADQWHYLNNPLSPGRKRRDTGDVTKTHSPSSTKGNLRRTRDVTPLFNTALKQKMYQKLRGDD